MHRGHWKPEPPPASRWIVDADGLPEGDDDPLNPSTASLVSRGRLNPDCGREPVPEGAWRLVALLMDAFRTWVNAGLMPQAKHGGRGVWTFAVVGSKLDGTGFGKLQMVQTQVADVACTGAADELRADASGAGDEELKEAAAARD